jgi:xylulokinase
MSVGGLDVGTSGCKIVAYTDAGDAIASASKAYEPLRDGIRCELDPRKVWDSVREILGKIARECSADPIEAISVTTLGEAGVPLDGRGEILENAILYNDPRGKAECQALVERLSKPRIMRITGHPASEMYSISKLSWMKSHDASFSRMKRFMLFEDFIIWKLTGIAVISHSLAARTMAFDVVEKKWSREIFTAAGIDPSIMSEAVPSGVVIGTIARDLADELGLSRGMKIVSGAHDQSCAALGGGALSPETSVDGVGSCEVLSIFLDQPRFDDFMVKGDYVCQPYLMEDTFLTYVNIVTSGAMLQWFRKTFLGNAVSYSQLDDLAGPEPSGLIVLPQFSVSATPHFSFDARGTIWGLTLGTSIGQVYRALMEGATFQILYNLELLERHGICAGELNVTGGGGASPLWLQIKADILGKTIHSLENSEASATGCMLLAAAATGKFGSLKEASAATLRPGKDYVPEAGRRERYMELYAKYKKIYEAYQDI